MEACGNDLPTIQHDGAEISDKQSAQNFTSVMADPERDIYLSGGTGDPARPPPQVPVNLFANPSDSTSGTSKTNDVNAFENNNIGIGNSKTYETSNGAEISHLFQQTLAQTANPPQHIITIIQDSDEENAVEGEESVPKEMLQRFVIEADGIHPSIQPIDDSTSPNQMYENDMRDMSSMGNMDNFNLDKQQVVIFSDETSHISNESEGFQICDNEPNELTITLMESPKTMSVMESRSEIEPNKNLSDQQSLKSISLNMDFGVEAEIATQDGEVIRREITTQTYPQKKSRRAQKRKLSTTKSDGNTKNMCDETESKSAKDKAKQSKMSNIIDERPFKCSKCSLKFAEEGIRDIHVRCHKDMSKIYECCFCQATFAQWLKMYHHLFEHGIEKPHRCDKCAFSCINKCDLVSHSSVHSDLKEFVCSKCGRPFKHRRNMMSHQKLCRGLDESGKAQKYEPEEKHICEVCNRQLSSKKSLEKHMEIHLDVKPFVCNECGHTTRLKESLILHKRTHTGEKPFKCDICDYATPDKSSLRRHKRRHNNDKPYKCQYCNYKCIQKHCLDTHVRRKHTGEQFVCGLCRYATHDRYGLNQHFKQHRNADGTMSSEILSESNEGNTETVVSIAPSTDNLPPHVYITLPSGAVLKSTEIGKNIMIEEEGKEVLSQQNNDAPMVIQMEENTGSGNSKKDAQHHQDVSDSSNPDSNTNKEEMTSIQLGSLEANLIQQIQQVGDQIFIQDTGEIVIRRQDGHILVIQQQYEVESEEITAT